MGIGLHFWKDTMKDAKKLAWNKPGRVKNHFQSVSRRTANVGQPAERAVPTLLKVGPLVRLQFIMRDGNSGSRPTAALPRLFAAAALMVLAPLAADATAGVSEIHHVLIPHPARRSNRKSV